MFSFMPNDIITSPKILFGRNRSGQLLERLTINVKRKVNCQLLGERRSGKTSVLECLFRILSEDQTFLPIIFNFKKHSNIKGNSNVFRFILANCVQQLTKKGIFNTECEVRRKVIMPTETWEDVYESLQDVDDYRITGLLEDFLTNISKTYKVLFVLLIDEYEYLFTNSFDNPNGFFVLRDLSNQPEKPLMFIIAGATKWNVLCSRTGSAELNNLGAGVSYVSPLESDDFSEMWAYCIRNIEEDVIADFDLAQVYIDSGGIPFYAKMIGEHILSGTQTSLFNNLKPHFIELYNNLEEDEIEALKCVIHGSHTPNTPILHDLTYRGILRKQDNQYIVNGALLSNYLIQKFGDMKSRDSLKESDELKSLGQTIQELISNINSTSMNKFKIYIFEVSNSDVKLYRDIEDICIDVEDLQRFAAALYGIVFERPQDWGEIIDEKSKRTVKRVKTLERLPNAFKRDHNFVKIIDALRQNYGGHITDLPTFNVYKKQMTKNELLTAITGGHNEPFTSTDFTLLQRNVLQMFVVYLNELQSYIRNETKPT